MACRSRVDVLFHHCTQSEYSSKDQGGGDRQVHGLLYIHSSHGEMLRSPDADCWPSLLLLLLLLATPG